MKLFSLKPASTDRDLWLIASGRAVSLLGDTVASTALVLHAHAAGWGATGVAAVIVCSALPLVLGAPLAGRLVDRADSHRLTVLAAGWEGLCALLLGIVLVAGGTGPDTGFTVVAVLALLVGLNAGQAVSGPAWTALLPAAVPEAALGRALGTVQAASTVATLSGSVLGGILVGGMGAGTALLVDAGTFGVLLVAALAVRARRRPGAADRARPRPLAGVTVLARDAVLGPVVGGMVVLVLCLHVVLVATVFLVRDVLHGSATAYGVVGTGFPAGMLLGSLLGGRISGRTRGTDGAGNGGITTRVRATVIGFAGLAAGVLACGLVPSLPALWTAEVVMGSCFGTIGVLVNVMILDRVPDALRGQALAAYIGALQACNIAGTFVGGPLTAAARPRAVYVIAGALGLAVVAGVALLTRGITTGPDDGRDGRAVVRAGDPGRLRGPGTRASGRRRSRSAGSPAGRTP